ncbi:terminase small subunit [Candidatus Accumulibacter contiguus]|jgi:phage terminase small subunit|uniref:Terminase small subunit n=1 Tax=Candidatus Accumulibacter phosphatis TaxID=327160 RepID=A0A080LW74_9PROT|nr:MAG: Terminase small subunit [Candidatus Accumulibacter phosphatis]
MSPLTTRQLAFVDAYCADGNAARAARAAGYAEKSAKVMACRLTKDNRIAAQIALRRAENAAKFEITKEEGRSDRRNIERDRDGA